MRSSETLMSAVQIESPLPSSEDPPPQKKKQLSTAFRSVPALIHEDIESQTPRSLEWDISQGTFKDVHNLIEKP